MRVGMITRTIPPFDRGGIQTHVAELSKALVLEGVEVHLFIVGNAIGLGRPVYPNSPVTDTTINGIQIHPIPTLILPCLTIAEYISFSLNCAKKIKKVELDLVHGQTMYSFGYARHKHLPFVLTIQGPQLTELRTIISSKLTINHLITDTFSVMMEAYAAKSADAIIVDSFRSKQTVSKEYGVPSGKIKVINKEGVDCSKFQVSVCNSNEILFVGRLHERKRIDKLIHAFAKVKLAVPDAKLKIVGSGELEKKLRTLVKNLGLWDDIQLTGFVPDTELPSHYANASVFVLPSAYEGFGIVLLEAMASGLPIVSVKTGVAETVIRHGWNGYLVDYETMADAIIKLLTDKPLCQKMGVRGRAIVKQRYTWGKIAHDMIKVYEEVM
jgi:glycosyltransferase involved in cell wall biosynthesis